MEAYYLMAAIKIYPADKWFSNCVRSRAGWRCEYENCAKYFPEGAGRAGLECAHFYSRRGKSTRWAADNAWSFCTAHHFLMDGNPADFVLFAEKLLGEGGYEILREKSRSLYRGRKHDLKEISKNYRDEYRRIEIMRDRGVEGRIEFESWC